LSQISGDIHMTINQHDSGIQEMLRELMGRFVKICEFKRRLTDLRINSHSFAGKFGDSWKAHREIDEEVAERRRDSWENSQPFLAKYVLGQWEINRAAKRKQLIQ
jgi:hypothetical protein